MRVLAGRWLPRTQVAGAVIMVGGSIVGLVCIAVGAPRILADIGAAGFGNWSLIAAIIGLYAPIEVGVTAATVRYWDAADVVPSATAASSQAVFLATVAILGGLLLSWRLGWIQGLSWAHIAVIGLAAPGVTLRAVGQAICLAESRFGALTLSAVSLTAGTWVGAAAGAHWGGSLGALVAIPFAACLSGGVSVLLCGQPSIGGILSAFRRWPDRDFSLYAAAVGVGAIGFVAFGSGDRLVVAAVFGPATLGYYSLISSVPNRLIGLWSSGWQVVAPRAVTLSKLNDAHALATYVVHATVVALLLAAVGGTALIVVMPKVLSVWVGSELAATLVVPQQCLIAIYATFAMQAPAYVIGNSMGYGLALSIIVLLGGSVTLLLIAVLSPLGLLGAALGNSGYLVTLVVPLMVVVLVRRSKIGRQME